MSTARALQALHVKKPGLSSLFTMLLAVSGLTTRAQAYTVPEPFDASEYFQPLCYNAFDASTCPFVFGINGYFHERITMTNEMRACGPFQAAFFDAKPNMTNYAEYYSGHSGFQPQAFIKVYGPQINPNLQQLVCLNKAADRYIVNVNANLNQAQDAYLSTITYIAVVGALLLGLASSAIAACCTRARISASATEARPASETESIELRQLQDPTSDAGHRRKHAKHRRSDALPAANISTHDGSINDTQHRSHRRYSLV